MAKKSNILMFAIIASMISGGCAFAASNSLLKMDVKRSSASDTVDVTFYTTESSSASVVTRKSGNRYVVLIPNVSSSSSVAPSVGAIKDLVSDIDVKSIDDGIGGYTKVTFNTTKPINIKTSMKQTAPLTQAQKDYKNLIAQNMSTTPKTTSQNTKSSTAAKKPAKTDSYKKPAAQTTTTAATVTKAAASKTETKPAVQPKAQVKPTEQQKINTNTTPKAESKPKVQEQTVTQQKPAPVKVIKEQPVQSAVQSTVIDTPVWDEASSQNAVSSSEAPMTPQDKKNRMIMWIVALYGLVRVMMSVSDKAKETFVKEDFEYKNDKSKEIMETVISDNDLTWQEKFKLYQQNNDSTPTAEINNKLHNENTAIKLEDTLKTIKKHKVEERVKPENIPTLNGQPAQKLKILNFWNVKDNSKKKVQKTQEMLKEELRAKIANLEHAYVNTPAVMEPVENFYGVRTEDEAISNKISKVKLTSFAKDKQLSSSKRELLEKHEPKVQLGSNEGKFVKLNHTPLNVSRRNSASTDVLGIQNKLYSKNGDMKMKDRAENYSLSSLGEYLSILDSEENSRIKNAEIEKSVSKIISSEISSKRSSSEVTNPIAKSRSPRKSSKSKKGELNGLKVKYNYEINSNTGIYLVDMDDVSAIVGKINDEITILKKFSEKISKPLQVRHDYDNVYIVKTGGFKCLVDVSNSEMKTLLEI